jgi:hypothetical protein
MIGSSFAMVAEQPGRRAGERESGREGTMLTMSHRLTTWTCVFAVAACSAPLVGHGIATPGVKDNPESRPPPVSSTQADAGANDSLVFDEVLVSPHTRLASDGYLPVIEPIELQVGPGRFMSAPASQVLMTGERLSAWPIYGSIVLPPR